MKYLCCEDADYHRYCPVNCHENLGVNFRWTSTPRQVDKTIEIYRERPIFYGCGDFLNDYEGISGYEAFRDDLTLMYFVTMEPRSGRLLSLTMTPLQIRQFRLHYPTEQDQNWLQQTMDRECAPLGTGVTKLMHGRFELDIKS